VDSCCLNPRGLTEAFGTVALAIRFDIRYLSLIAALCGRHPNICAYLLLAAFSLMMKPKAWELLRDGGQMTIKSTSVCA
jgi:hypothetical protein